MLDVNVEMSEREWMEREEYLGSEEEKKREKKEGFLKFDFEEREGDWGCFGV